jgi:2-dehydro-3-deoxy-D-arabinonate dehydratase
MKLWRTETGPVVEEAGAFHRIADPWDALLARDDLAAHLKSCIARGTLVDRDAVVLHALAPVVGQEVWAAGVTYFRSREARIEESKDAGGGDFYGRVYEAERPELFFKATPRRVEGPGGAVRTRRDSTWNVPEPELAVVASATGRVVGYTIGNDMSSRSIEGENPLYLPQAKVYEGSCALGPAILVREEPLPRETSIAIRVTRRGEPVFEGATTLAQMKRAPQELVDWLYRECSFPAGCVLLTGTGVVPPASFTLAAGDEIRITIEPIGTLVNRVA